MSNKNLLSLAIINIQWTEKKDYIDNFCPFVINVIQDLENEEINIGDIKDKLEEKFSLKIPTGSLKTILGRLHERKFIKSENNIYKKIEENLSKYNFQELSRIAQRKYKSLIRNLIKFVKEKYSIDWDTEKAEELIFKVVEFNSFEILNFLVNGDSYTLSKEDKSDELIVHDFIVHLYEEDNSGLDCFDSIIKGYFLTNVLFYEKIFQIEKNFSNLTIYFDTSFIIRLLGFTFESYKKSYEELIDMLRIKKANLKIFEHNFKEISRVLTSYAYALDKPNPYYANKEAFIYLRNNGYRSTQVLKIIDDLEFNLKKEFGIYIEKDTQRYTNTQIDEGKILKYLSEKIYYRNRKSLEKDIDSLSLINHIRKTNQHTRLSNTIAIFATDNSKLAYYSKKYFEAEENYQPTSIPHSLHVDILTTLVWLKIPSKYPDLPKKVLIANSYSALNPSDNFWGKVVDEYQNLYDQKQISEDDLNFAIYSNTARKTLMTISNRNFDVFTEGDAIEVLRHSKEKLLKEERAKVRKAENETKERDSIISSQNKILENIAEDFAKTIVCILDLIYALLIVFSMLLDNNIIDVRDKPFLYVSSIIFTSLNIIIFLISRFYNKISFKVIKLKIHNFLYEKRFNFLTDPNKSKG